VAFAKHYFGTVTAVGRLFQVDNRHQMEIVGVVQDARFDGIRLAAPRLVFFPAEGYKGTLLSLAVRTAGDPERAEASVRKAISLVDATLSIPETTTVESLIDDSLAQERLLAKLSSLFGMLALGIAAVGLYGLMAYNVSKRTNEFGLRMAVGASERQIKAMVMGDTATLLLIGSLLGLVASLAATQALTTFLFDLHATDPWMLALSFAVLFFVGLGAGWMPACRASGINPISALRHE
jgi:ABC-type antimicrobial peptide transport system permease subunit